MSEQSATAIFIFGMHRSGTSALTRLVNLLGAKIGDNLLGPAEDNQHGYWEQIDVIEAHQKLLAAQGADWKDYLPLPSGWVDSPEAQNAQYELRSLVQKQFKNAPLWVIKDPRISILFPLWSSLVDELGVTPRVLFAVRHPLEVAASLEIRDRISEDAALLTWLHYNLMGELHSRTLPRAFIEYPKLIENWESLLAEASKRIGVTWPVPMEKIKDTAAEFLSKELRHHSSSANALKDTNLLRGWCNEIYRALKEAAKTGTVDTATFDRIRRDWFSLLSPARSLVLEEVTARRTAEKSLELETSLLESSRRRQVGLSQELTRAKEDYALLEKTLLMESNRVQMLMHSTSWRITMPLRFAMNLLRYWRLFFKPSSYLSALRYLQENGWRKFLDGLQGKRSLPSIHGSNAELTRWFQQYRMTPVQLEQLKTKQWGAAPPFFSIIMCSFNTRKEWLEQALTSVCTQIYSHFELIVVDDGSTEPQVREVLEDFAKRDARVKPLFLSKNLGVSAATNRGAAQAKGDYICFMDHDDFLEPQALFRFAEAIQSEQPDLIYSDEARTGEDIEDIGGVAIRPKFSHDYYLSHPYFVHFIAVKREVFEAAKGLNEDMRISQDVDFVLRALEHSRKVSNVSDILYRWRTVSSSLGHTKQGDVTEATSTAIERHLRRIGYPKAQVTAGKSFNFYNVNYGLEGAARIAVIIPTKNHGELLRNCIESVVGTVPPEMIDIYVIDHDSDDAMTRDYLEELRQVHTVIPYSGPFNFSALMNLGVRSLKKKPYTHYLLLNNDIEAVEAGWLEHMLNLARRPEVGIVGSLLLYPDTTVQHAGVLVGIHHSADHACRFVPYKTPLGHNHYVNGVLSSVRDYSAVTAACMLVRADAFAAVDGFDEKLAVGYGDTDFCLRVVEAGYKVLFDPYATLVHYESVSRGKGLPMRDPHPKDSNLFRHRWKEIIRNGDPFYSPLYNQNNPFFEPAEPVRIRYGQIHSSTGVVRPAPAKPSQDARDKIKAVA